MTSSTRDGWERLVAAVLKREQFRQLCRQDSVSTVSSEGFSDRTLSFSSNRLSSRSVPPSPLIPLRNPNLYQGTFSYVGRLQRFTLGELRAATNDFSYENILPGAINVYRGWLAGSQVAVKSYKQSNSRFAKIRFQRGLEINKIAAHPNVLHILVFCYTPKNWLLVFPLMVNRSVATCLWDRHESQPPLDCTTRKGIALGVAKGIAHLHEECDKKILHRDIKAANILLNEDFKPVVTNLEKSIVVENNATDIRVEVARGTIGHMAPEYMTTFKCTEKTDVFGYGMFLLELITGQRALDLSRLANGGGQELLEWVKRKYTDGEWEIIADANGGGSFTEDLVRQLMQIALICTSYSPEERLMMSEVVRMLENEDGLAEKWEEWYRKHECLSFPLQYNFTSVRGSL